MPPELEIRADYDRDTIVVYQAYPDWIAVPAIEAGTLVAPFNFNRMTWIKPSFLWLMERSNWARKAGQERILAVRITRVGWDEALSAAVLTHWAKGVYPTHDAWRSAFDAARVHVQWDPERSVRGESLTHRSIQVGVSRHLSGRYASEWIREIRDLTPLVQKLRDAKPGERSRHLPRERPYPVDPRVARRLGMDVH